MAPQGKTPILFSETVSPQAGPGTLPDEFEFFLSGFIVLAVNQDAHGVDKRAALFKATTWEEVNMLAQTDSYIESAAESIYSSVTDLAILDILRVRQEEIDGDIHRRERLAELEKLLVEKKTLLAEQSKQINELKNRLTS